MRPAMSLLKPLYFTSTLPATCSRSTVLELCCRPRRRIGSAAAIAWWNLDKGYIRDTAGKLVMHTSVVAVAPLSRRHAFREADEVLYSGQLQTDRYKVYNAHAVYLRDKSEVVVIGKSATDVERRTTELRLLLGSDVEYFTRIVYMKGLSKQSRNAKTRGAEGWVRK